MRYYGTVVTIFGSRGIVGCSDIEKMGVADDVHAALVNSKLVWRP